MKGIFLNAHTNAIQSGFLVFEQNAKKHLGLVTIISAILGVLFPAVGSLLLPFVMPMLFILMVFATLKIDLDRLIRAIKRPGLLITGICILYIVVPLTMYTLAILANLTADITLGVLFAALAPPIISAPIFVDMIEGDIEFSYVLSVISTLASPIVIPILVLLIAGRTTAIPLIDVVLPIASVVILPGILVFFLQKLTPKIITILKSSEGSISAIDFLVLIWAIIAANAPKILSHSNTIYILFIMAIVQVFGFFFAIRFLSKQFLSEKLSKALALSIGIRNAALTAGIGLLFSTTVALPSGIVVLANVLMITLASLLRNKL